MYSRRLCLLLLLLVREHSCFVVPSSRCRFRRNVERRSSSAPRNKEIHFTSRGHASDSLESSPAHPKSDESGFTELPRRNDDSLKKAYSIAAVTAVAMGFAEPSEAASAAAAAGAATVAIGSSTGLASVAFISSISAAKSSIIQTLLFIWTRATLNYQYRTGLSFRTALRTLLDDGGVKRLYSGVLFALIHVPSTRFCDVLSNEISQSIALPLPVRSLGGSVIAGGFRLILTPFDTLKTSLQVNGPDDLRRIVDDVKSKRSIENLYRGGLGIAVTSVVGHYPFFLTYNLATSMIPETATSPTSGDGLFTFLLYRGAVGVASSTVSDCTSNILRVLKTYRQTTDSDMSYPDLFKTLLAEEDGDLFKLATRGLSTRVVVNAVQTGVFSVGWKYFQAMDGGLR